MTNYQGIIPPMVTPFSKSGEIAESRLRAHVDFLIDAGVHGLFPGASLGEISNLSTDELSSITKIVVDQADGNCPVYAGVGASGTRQAVVRTKQAEAVGADGVIAITPYYLEPDQEGMRKHYSKIADSTELPVFLYHLPSATGQTLEVETIDSLARMHENIVGIKDSSGDLMWGANVMAETPENFAYFQGHDPLLLPSLVLGADGGVNGTANIAPRFLLSLLEAYQEGEIQKARRIQLTKVTPLSQACMKGTFPGGFKEAARLAGHELGVPRLPILRPSDKEREQIAKTLDSLNLRMSEE